MQRYSGIEGLEGRDPIGAALTVGRKGPSGAPIETDRFFLVSPVDSLVGQHRIRPPHPSFAAFNEADPKHRQTIRGNIVHAKAEDCFEHHLRAQVLSAKWPAHPAKRPACTGNGVKATRFFGILPDKSEDWREIDTCGELCEFRIGANKLCKPFARFLFRPRWENGKLPTPLVKLTTGSWYSVSALLGFFDYIRENAASLGVENPSLYGLPFVLTLSMKTKPQEQRRFPVLSISPEVDLVQFLLAQKESHSALSGDSPRLLSATLSDPKQQSSETLASDYAAINPGHAISKPAEPDTIDVEPERDAGLLSAAAIRRIEAAATAKGLTLDDVGKIAGGSVRDAPSGAELEILRTIAEHKKARK